MKRKITKKAVEYTKETLKLYAQQQEDSEKQEDSKGKKSQGSFYKDRNLRDTWIDKARTHREQSATNSCGY